MKKNIAIIGIVGVPANYGGFETLVDNLLDFLKEFKITVYCSSKNYALRPKYYKSASLEYIQINANGYKSVLYDSYSILKSYRGFDSILILGVSGAICLPLLKLINPKIQIICNLDGLEWKRNKWSRLAKIFLKFSEYVAVKFSDKIIADNIGIKDYVQRTYNINSYLIPYGAKKNNLEKFPLLKKLGLDSIDYALKVCRVEPENNLEIILKTFSKLKNENLVIVGNWSSSNFGKKLKNKYSCYNNIFLLDPIYNKDNLDQIRLKCKVYIHGHSAGGTNPSLVEAIALNLFIISYDINFNRYTLDNLGLYFKNESDLKEIILSSEKFNLKEYKTKLSKLFNKNYKWEKIANSYKQLF